MRRPRRPVVRRLMSLAAAIVVIACGGQAPAASPASQPAGPSATSAVPSPSAATSAAPPASGAPAILAIGSESPGPASSQAPVDPAWTQALHDVDPAGGRSASSALKLFALAFGPIPGVDAPRLATPVLDATLALRSVRQHWNELTPDQRVAIEAAVKPSPSAFHFTVQPAPTARVDLPSPYAPVLATSFIHANARSGNRLTADSDQELSDAANQLRAFFVRKLHSDISAGMEVFAQDPSPGAAAVGTTDPTWDGATYATCTIVINRGPDSSVVLTALAQQVFHCMQAGYYPADGWAKAPSWIIEAAAEWAGNQGASDLGHSKYDQYWSDYFDNAATPLFERSIDAFGFYTHLDNTGTSPWTTMPRMFRDGSDSQKAFVDAGASTDRFLGSWASSMARQQERGPLWTMSDVSLTSASIDIQDYDLGDGDSLAVGAVPYTNAVSTLNVSAAFIEVDLPGNTRIADSHGDRVGVAGATFCVKSEECAKPCPDGTKVEKARRQMRNRRTAGDRAA